MSLAIKEFQGPFRWLSNFWPVQIRFSGIEYRSVENAYQAAKTEDDDIRLRISAMTPSEAKRAGRRIKVRADWEENKEAVMYYLVSEKFRDAHLKQLLLATKDCELIEGNNWGDTFWGVCGGKGENRLGKILMRVREEIRPIG